MNNMNQLQKFSQEHFKLLCQRGISTLIAFALIFKAVYSGITIFNGVSFPFQEGQLATQIFYHRITIFFIICTALLFQLFHLFVQRVGLVSKLVLVLLLASLVVNLNTQYQAKQLYIENNESVTQLDYQIKCQNNSKLLWPSLSQQLYEEANKMNCSQNCPCTNQQETENNQQFTNFQSCLALNADNIQSSNSINSSVNKSQSEQINYNHSEQISNDLQYQKIAQMQRLSKIEQYLQCSGICESNKNFFFWDVNQKPQTQETCYSIAANQIQQEILQYTKNYNFTIIFSIFCTLIQEIFLYKSTLIIQFAKSKLGACLSLPITAPQNFNQLNNENEKQQQSENKEQKIKIHLIDLPKKVTKNKEQKCVLSLKVSPKLLKSDTDIQSPDCNSELPKIIPEDSKNCVPQEQN